MSRRQKSVSYTHLDVYKRQENHSAYIGNVAMTCNNLGALYYNTKRYKEVEEMYKEALGIYRELAKENRSAHIGNVADTCNNLGALYYNTKRYKEVEEMCKEALKIYRGLSSGA